MTARSRRDARPRAADGKPLRASLFHERGPWNPSPTAALWVFPAGAKIAVIAIMVATTFVATSPGFTDYINGLPDVKLVAAHPMAQDTLIYASDRSTLLADLHAPGHQQYYCPFCPLASTCRWPRWQSKTTTSTPSRASTRERC